MEIICVTTVPGYTTECILAKSPGGSLPKYAGIGASTAGNGKKCQQMAKQGKNGKKWPTNTVPNPEYALGKPPGPKCQGIEAGTARACIHMAKIPKNVKNGQKWAKEA